MTQPALARQTKQGRVYRWQGKDYPSVTTILGATMPKPALVPWAARLVAEYAVANQGAVTELLRQGDERAAVDLLKGAPFRDRDRAADVGTAVHGYAERIANGESPDVPPEVAPFVPHFLAFLRDWQPEYIETEATVFSDDLVYAGSFDAVVDLGGRTTLIDYKTSTGVYHETALQLAAYDSADFIGRDDGETTAPLPYIDDFAVLHLRPDGYALVPFTITDEVYAQWERCVLVHRYLRDVAPTVVGQPRVAA